MVELPTGEWRDPPPNPPVMSRDPNEVPDELPRGADIPDDLDPLEDGVLMTHQADWIADESILKICAKAYVADYIKVPDNHSSKGADGFDRHGDAAIACALGYFASRAQLEAYGYTKAADLDQYADHVAMFEPPSMGGLIPKISGGLH